jgi:hypothetical protein
VSRSAAVALARNGISADARIPFLPGGSLQRALSFSIGDRVQLGRDLPSLRADTEGIVRGVLANANGIRYAIRFDNEMRVVSERDLRARQKSLR